MIELGGVTSALVELGLDAAVLRQQVIANNLANADTPGYLPKRVDFESLFTAAGGLPPGPAADRALQGQIDEVGASLRSGETVHAVGNAKVEMDVEMARLTENVIRFRALLEANAKRTAVLRLAINEGRTG